MFPRWFLVFALVCGVFFEPFAATEAHAHQPGTSQVVNHCTPAKEAEKHAPVKQCRCMGVNSAVEIAIPRLAIRTTPGPKLMLVAKVPLLSGISLDRETPPPRTS